MPSVIELGILVGSLGWFMTFFLIFTKTLPGVAIMEVKEMVAPPIKGSLEAK